MCATYSAHSKLGPINRPGAEEEMPRLRPKASKTATHSLARKLNQLTAVTRA